MFIPSGWKDTGIIKFEFLENIFLSQNCFFWKFVILTLSQILTQRENMCKKRNNMDRLKESFFAVFSFALLLGKRMAKFKKCKL